LLKANFNGVVLVAVSNYINFVSKDKLEMIYLDPNESIQIEEMAGKFRFSRACGPINSILMPRLATSI